MLKIWGRLSSMNVQKVVICANELGLRFERIEAGGKFGVVDTPEYRKLNPNGLVPTIEDGDFVLWESNAIVRYLARVHGAGKLWPSDPRVAADADRWMDWQTTRAAPAMGDAFVQLVRTPADKRDMNLVAASIAKSEPVMAMLDAHLATRSYVAGDYSMGDIPVACSAHRWLGLPCPKERRRHVESYVERVAARPAYQGILTLPLT
jgi:glutathione S-transferase